jgi:hypothetical protein
MVARIEEFERLEEILIIDNGSTYEPLLHWYETIPHKVIKVGNLGHTAPWSPEVKERIRTGFYVVTDPDLDLSQTPSDCLLVLARCLAANPRVGKVGLGLTFDRVTPASPYYAHVQTCERGFWSLPLDPGGYRWAPVDTTFAMYHKTVVDEYRICGVRMDRPYVAEHVPWSVVTPDQEFSYYLARANASSSYKAFVTNHRFLEIQTEASRGLTQVEAAIVR